jgi:hypothetical protein
MKGQKATSHVRKVLQCGQEHGIMALGFFILGAPGDTMDTCRKTIDFSLTLPLAYAQYQIAIIKPHTELEKRHVIEATGIDYWREYMRGALDEHLLPTPWTELTRPELERLARKAFFRFYGRPFYALRMLLRIESFDELQRYFRVAVQLFLRPLRPPTGRTLPAWRRGLRAAGTFVEALLTSFNPGARHPVFRAGGGLRGAWKLARAEYGRVNADPMLTRERAEALLENIRLREGARPPGRPAPGMYLPVMDVLRADADAASSAERR